MFYVKMRPWRAATLSLMLAVAACGGDDEATPSTPAGAVETTVADTPETTATGVVETVPASPAQPSGEPFVLGVINLEGSTSGPSFPTASASAVAAVDYINENMGGLHGRPIEVKLCTVDMTPEKGTGCANQMVADDVDAVLRLVFPLTDVALPIIQDAEIPFVSAGFASTLELTSTEGVYSFSTGQLGLFGGTALVAKQQGAKTVSYVTPSTPSTTGNVDLLLNEPYAAAGLDVNVHFYDIATADFLPIVSVAVQDEPDVVVINTATLQCVPLIQGLDSVGFEGDIIVSSTCEGPGFYDSLGPLADGLIVLSQDDAGASGEAAYDADRAIMLEVLNDAGVDEPAGLDIGALTTVMNLHRVLDAAEPADDLESQWVTDALAAARDVPRFLGSDTTLTCDGTPVPEVPALCSNTVFAVQRDGETVTGLGTFSF